MNLTEAVDKLAVHLAKGGAMPNGRPGSCLSCPVARYLAIETGHTVAVDGHEAWYIDEDYPPIRVSLRENIVRWIDEFDEEESWN